MNKKIQFSQIDATNYPTVYFFSIYDNEIDDNRTDEEKALEQVMEVDYLKRLKRLQDDITNEYKMILQHLENGTELNLPEEELVYPNELKDLYYG